MKSPKRIYRADYHCKLVDRDVFHEVRGLIIDCAQVRYFTTKKMLHMSLRNTRDMTITKLQITTYYRYDN